MERVFGDQRLELADEFVVQPERQVGVDARLERRHPQLAEPRDLAAISGPPSTSAYGWPRHSSSAWRNRREAVAGSSGRPAAPSRYLDSKRPASVSSAATVNT